MQAIVKGPALRRKSGFGLEYCLDIEMRSLTSFADCQRNRQPRNEEALVRSAPNPCRNAVLDGVRDRRVLAGARSGIVVDVIENCRPRDAKEQLGLASGHPLLDGLDRIFELLMRVLVLSRCKVSARSRDSETQLSGVQNAHATLRHHVRVAMA